MVQREGGEFHRTSNDDLEWGHRFVTLPRAHLSGDGVEDFSVLEDDQSGHVRDYLTFSELFAHINLYVREPHLGHEVCWAHEAPVSSPVGGSLVDNDPGLLPHEVHVQLECHGQCNVVYFWNLERQISSKCLLNITPHSSPQKYKCRHEHEEIHLLGELGPRNKL